LTSSGWAVYWLLRDTRDTLNLLPPPPTRLACISQGGGAEFLKGVDMAKPISFGGRSFKTKKQAIEFCRGLLSSGFLGVGDQKDLASLLELHPDYEEKAGPGVEMFYLDKDPWGKTCFHIQRVDGTTDNFSYLACINGANSPLQDFMAACRSAVVEDINAFRAAALAATQACPVSEEPLTGENCHVDHTYPNTFKSLCLAFLGSLGAEPEDYPIAKDGYGEAFQHKEHADLFREYHQEHATLRLLHKRVNLSLGDRRPALD